MFDHVSIGVTELARAGRFYDAVMAALGHVRLTENPRHASYGPPGFPGEPPFAILLIADGAPATAPRQHLAFAARDRAAVDAFHAAALAHGGKDEGAPGPRPHYGPNFYTAYVRDPDGNKLNAVFLGGA